MTASVADLIAKLESELRAPYVIKTQPYAVLTLEQCRDILEALRRLTHEPASAPMAPIAAIRVGENDTCEVLHLYAPGLPPGEHDLYPAASAQPPVNVQGVVFDRLGWICSVCHGWNHSLDKHCTHTHTHSGSVQRRKPAMSERQFDNPAAPNYDWQRDREWFNQRLANAGVQRHALEQRIGTLRGALNAIAAGKMTKPAMRELAKDAVEKDGKSRRATEGEGESHV